MRKYKNLVGKCVDIIDKESQYYGHWGYIKVFDGDVYHIEGGSISETYGGKITPIFDRDQFKIRKES
jgi:hypothetical protein